MQIGDVKNKTILVTGASSGIGRAIAVACAQGGARVVLLARNVERLEETRALCGEGGHAVYSADLNDLDSISSLVRRVSQEVGPLSGMVHSAGLVRLKPLRALRGKDLEEIFRVNAAAGIMLVKGFSARGCHVLPASAVLVSSVVGRVGNPGQVAYCASKAAVDNAVRAMALELVADRIRVNAVAPAGIDAAGQLKSANAAALGALFLSDKVLAAHPSGLGTCEDVAGAVLYLLSDASRYVTGTSLVVDGGYLAQ